MYKKILEVYTGLFSGGKDSLTVCHYLWQKDLLEDVLYCKTGIGVKENVEFVEKTCKYFNWKLNVIEPKKGETMEDFVRKFGFPHQGMHSAIMGFLKWHPMRKYGREHPGIVYASGRRKKESNRRAHNMKTQLEHPEKNMTFWAELFNWSTADVWKYLKENKLEICPVYETMHMSGDCMCGAFSESGEAELLATFHPETAAYIKYLELTHGVGKTNNRWGNGSSMCGAMNQSKMTPWLCSECGRV